MANRMPIKSAAAGSIGSAYTAKIASANVPAGDYLFNDTNFPGLGVHIPGWALVIPAATPNATLAFSSDNGTTWIQSNYGSLPDYVYMDSASTTRLHVGSTVNITIFPMDN